MENQKKIQKENQKQSWKERFSLSLRTKFYLLLVIYIIMSIDYLLKKDYFMLFMGFLCGLFGFLLSRYSTLMNENRK